MSRWVRKPRATPAHAELFSSRQAALSSRGDSSCIISGRGGAGRRLTAGIAWHRHRPGRNRGIWRVALGGTPSPLVSSERQLVEQSHLPRGRGARVGMAGDGDGVAPALPQAARRGSTAKGTKSGARLQQRGLGAAWLLRLTRLPSNLAGGRPRRSRSEWRDGRSGEYLSYFV